MDTGRAGTIYGESAEHLLGKSFFAKHDLLPRNGYRLESLHQMPAPHFSFLGAGASQAVTKGQLVFTGTAGHVACMAGWNFGADYTKALFILTNAHPGPSKQFMFLHDAEPTDRFCAGAKGIGLQAHQFTGAVSLGRIDAASGLTAVHGTSDCAGWTPISAAGSFVTVVYGQSQGMALYIDTAGGGTVKVFIRLDFSQWIEVLDTTSAHLGGVIRCASLSGHPNVSSSNIVQLFGGPIGIYAGN